MYDTLYWEGEVAATLGDGLVYVDVEMSSNSAVRVGRLDLGSVVTSTMTCVGCLAMGDFRPGPLTRQVEANCYSRRVMLSKGTQISSYYQCALHIL